MYSSARALAVVVGQLNQPDRERRVQVRSPPRPGRQVTDRIRKEAKGAASNKDDVDALKAAIVATRLKVLDAGTRMTGEAQARLPKQLKPVYSKCRRARGSSTTASLRARGAVRRPAGRA